MNLHLFRNEVSPDGVFGRLIVQGGGTLFTLEDDPNDSVGPCIPAGQYVLRRTVYRKKGYETFEVSDVPKRSRILIHPGNTENDVRGCIAVGMRRGWVTVLKDEDTGAADVEKRAVVESQKAFRQLMDWLGPVDNAELTIEWDTGLP